MRTQRFTANLFLALPLIFGTVKPAAAQDKEPTYRGRTVSQWAARVGYKETDVAERAVRAITKMGPDAKNAAPALLAIIRTNAGGFEEEYQRCKPAMAALKGIGPEVVPAIREALKGGAAPGDFNRINFVTYVSDVLGEIGPGAKAAIPELIANLKDATGLTMATMAVAIQKALRKIGAAAIPALVEALQDKKFAEMARNVLNDRPDSPWEIGPDAKTAVPALLELLKAKENADRKLAAQLLGKIGPEAKEALPLLAGLLKDADVSLRIVVAEAVLRLAPAHSEARAVLDDARKDPKWKANVERALERLETPLTNAALLKQLYDDKQDKQKILRFLVKRGVRSPEMIPALIEYLGDEESEAPSRRVGVGPLIDIGTPAIPALLKAIRTDNYRFRGRNKAAVVLAAIDPSPRMVAVLLEALKDNNNHSNDFPTGLMRALAEIGPDAKEAVPVLLEFLPRRKGEVTYWPNEAAKALGEIGIGDKKVVAALTEALKDPVMVPDVVRGLVLLGPSSAPILLDALRRDALRDKELVQLFNSCAEGLGELGKGALPTLIEALNDKHLPLRVAVIRILERMGADAKPAVQALIEASKKDKASFDAVNDALKRIDPEAWKKAGFK